MTHRSTPRYLTLAVAAGMVTAAACGSEPLACTAEFRVYGITVLDGGGAPVPDLDPTVTLVRTGQEIVPDTTLASRANGFYVVLTDAQGSILGQTGRQVRFSGTNGIVSTSADFVFAAGVCHVEKISGPDTLVAQ